MKLTMTAILSKTDMAVAVARYVASEQNVEVAPEDVTIGGPDDLTAVVNIGSAPAEEKPAKAPAKRKKAAAKPKTEPEVEEEQPEEPEVQEQEEQTEESPEEPETPEETEEEKTTESSGTKKGIFDFKKKK